MTSELQQNRYDRLIRRVGGIIGVGSKVSEVLTELFPMIDVETQKGELQLLAQTTLGMGTHGLVGSAGQNAKVQVFNPVDSGRIITVTDIFMNSESAIDFFIARTTIQLPSGIGTQLTRDTRQSLVDRPVGLMFSGTGAAFTDPNIRLRAPGSNQLHLHCENDIMVLAPGSGCQVGAGSNNTVLNVSFIWRERTAETSELNF